MAHLARHRPRHRRGRAAARRRIPAHNVSADAAARMRPRARRERNMKLKDKVAIVTGGARGIGLAIAKRYVAEGAKVVIADIDETAGAAAATTLKADGRFVRTDVGDARDAERLVNGACDAFGHLDILVNNAGIIHAADFLELAEADFDRVLR